MGRIIKLQVPVYVYLYALYYFVLMSLRILFLHFRPNLPPHVWH